MQRFRDWIFYHVCDRALRDEQAKAAAVPPAWIMVSRRLSKMYNKTYWDARGSREKALDRHVASEPKPKPFWT